jgi:hypothetical protein
LTCNCEGTEKHKLRVCKTECVVLLSFSWGQHFLVIEASLLPRSAPPSFVDLLLNCFSLSR